MKKIFGIVLFLCFFTINAFAIDVWDNRQTVTVTWDASTGATSYKVWIKAIEPDGVPALYRSGITTLETSVTFQPGKWVVGVQSKNDAGESDIAWSNNPAYTYQGKTYAVNYQPPVIPPVIPPIPSGIKIIVAGDLLPNLIVNGNFDGTFTGGIGQGWTKATDGGNYSFASDAGRSGGFSQKMTVVQKTSWGFFLAQPVTLTLNKTYSVFFWYKAAGGSLSAAVCNDQHTQVVIDQSLPDTAGQWAFASFDFVYSKNWDKILFPSFSIPFSNTFLVAS